MIFGTARRLALGGGPRRKHTLRRLRGGILGLALSLIPLTIVTHVAEGMIRGITSRYLETGTGHLRLRNRLPMAEDQLGLTAAQIRQIPGVISASIERDGTGLARSGRGNTGIQIRGVDESWYRDDKRTQEYIRIVEGDFSLAGERSAVIGKGVADELGLAAGDELRLLTVRRGSNGRLLPRITRFEVAGIISTGYRDLDRFWVFVSLQNARTIIPDESASQYITVKVEEPFDLPNPLSPGDREAGRNLLADLRVAIPAQYTLQTWFDLEQSQYMNFIGTKNMLIVIMIVILLVAAVNISSTMIGVVQERQQEFAVLKALGMGRSGIAGIVVVISGISGILGCIIGLALGVLGSLGINEIISGLEFLVNLLATDADRIQLINPEFYLERIPVEILPGQLLVLALAAFGMTLLSGLVPALRASRISPVVLFRKE